ncbi:hypothetical protein MBANPS3_006464 [Mucor bainieri]
MSMPNASLTSEKILTLIMSYIGSLSQLKECRLVCKAWCNPGLINMLGQNITLRSELGIFRLDACSFILKELLHLILTPNIESIKGEISNNGFYIEFNRAMKRWPNQFEKMTEMTSCYEVTTPYFEALSHFKNTLQKMVFNIGKYNEHVAYDCAKHLSEFHHLTSLSVEGWYQRLWSMEDVLKYCPYIEELSLNIHEESRNVLDRKAVRDWATSTVEQQCRLKKLVIKTDCPADYMEYLFYKYPSIESISIDIELDDEYIEVNMYRIANLIRNVPSKHIVFTVGTGLDVREILQSLQAYSYHAVVDKVHVNGDLRLILAQTV